MPMSMTTTQLTVNQSASVLIAKQSTDVTSTEKNIFGADKCSDVNQLSDIVPVLLTAAKLPRYSLPSPKSALLEDIQQKKSVDRGNVTHSIGLNSMSSITIATNIPLLSPSDCMKRPTTIETDLVVNTALIECSKSPILSQPKTIRFPANDSRNGLRRSDHRAIGCCYWDGCNAKCESSSNLLDHLQTQHVNSQTGPFTCRWANCKVHGRESCSRKWLERHVLSHGGSKFFKCIFDKCRMRFGSQVIYSARHL